MDIIKSLIVFVLFVAMLCGCTTTRYVPMETVSTEARDVVREVNTRDTMRLESYIYDRGDTVVIARDRWHTVWRTRSDTVRVVRTDSIPVPVPTERKLTPWERTRLDYGGYAIVALCIVISAAVVWLARAFIRR